MRIIYRMLIFAVLATLLGILLVQKEGGHIYFGPGEKLADSFYRIVGGIGFMLLLSSAVIAVVASVSLCRKLQPVSLLVSGLAVAAIAILAGKCWTSIGPGFGMDNWTMLMIVPLLAASACGALMTFAGLVKAMTGVKQ
jgi:hypothetical protein